MLARHIAVDLAHIQVDVHIAATARVLIENLDEPIGPVA
jgi:hypothetical protein